MLAVTTAASDLNLLTIAELRAAVGVSDGAQDDKLIILGKRVSAVIAKVCKVAADGATPPTLRRETLTETYRLKSVQDSLILSRRPITSVTSIVEDGTALVAADYEIDAATGLLRRLDDDDFSCWPAVKIVVVYLAGWETVPEDLKLAATKLAAVFYSEGDRVDPNLKAIDIPGVESREYWVSPSDDPLVPGEVLDLLAPYRNHWF